MLLKETETCTIHIRLSTLRRCCYFVAIVGMIASTGQSSYLVLSSLTVQIQQSHLLSVTAPTAGTGTEVHLNACGQPWEEYYTMLPVKDAQKENSEKDSPLQWTIAEDNEEYRDNAQVILTKWKILDLYPVLVVAMDETTSKTVCDAGFASVYWTEAKASYSRVADVKFGVAAAMAEKGYRGFFIEMDVFCRRNPVPLFMKYVDRDLINVGNGDVGWSVNIGVFMASNRMGPWFQSIKAVLKESLDHPTYRNEGHDIVNFVDQAIYQHCLPYIESHDDDFGAIDSEYYHLHDTEQQRNLLQLCKESWEEGSDFKTLPHHLMSNKDPPTVYDSTYCIRPLSYSDQAAPLSHKIGVAKFLGFDPSPIGIGEKILKLESGVAESHNCWQRSIPEVQTRMDEWRRENILGNMYASVVEIALATNRTLILPRHFHSNDAYLVPTHALLDVRTLGGPYRFMSSEDAYALRSETRTITASKKFEETLTNSLVHHDAKVLAINKICTIRDEELPVLQARKKKMKWCVDREFKWSRTVGGWMDFCSGDGK